MVKKKIALFLGLLVYTVLAQADWVSPSERVQESITLRASPSSQGAYLGQLLVGERLIYKSAVPYWYQVELPSGQPAFVSKAWSTLIPDVAPTNTADSFTLDVVDVGTGLAVFINGPDFTLLYDGGSNDDMARGADNRLLAFLRKAYPQLNRLQHVILSHPHRDHVELLPDVLNQYAIGDVWDSGVVNDICGYRAFLDTVQSKGVIYHSAKHNHGIHPVELTKESGTCYGIPRTAHTMQINHGAQIDESVISLGVNASMQFLHASAHPHTNINENSLVLRLDLGNHRILLMGDAGAGPRAQWGNGTPDTGSIEGMLLACCKALLRSDILIVGHHGSRTSSRRAFLDAVQAKTYVISSGPKKYASVTLPDQVVVDALTARGQLFRTDRNDAACLVDESKMGPDADNRPGGCDNVRITIGNTINAEYQKFSDND